MAVYFQLTKKGETEPTKLQDVDVEIAHHFGEEPDAVRWFHGWFDCVGFGLACGDSFDEIRKTYHDLPDLVKIADFLEANYTVNCWAGR